MDVTEGNEQDLDRVIDVVARRMLDVEPPAGLRHRVLERVAAPRRRLTWAWLVVPAAAALMLALLWPRSNERIVPSRTATDYHLPPAITAAVPPAAPPVRRPVREPERTTRLVHATSVDERLPVEDSRTLPALAVPTPIGVQTIAEGSATPIGDVAVPPIEIRALQVNALPEAPENRREE